MIRALQIGLGALLLLYPFWVSYSLSRQWLLGVAAVLIFAGVMRLFISRASALWPLSLLAIICGGSSALLNDPFWLKLYPVMMSIGALSIFAATLIRPPSMIERLARLAEPNLPEAGVRWTRQVTWVWCGFFVLNALIASWTVIWGTQQQWLLYNGFISYLLMAVLFGGEFVLRKRKQRLNSL